MAQDLQTAVQNGTPATLSAKIAASAPGERTQLRAWLDKHRAWAGVGLPELAIRLDMTRRLRFTPPDD